MTRRNTVRSARVPFPRGRVPFLREAHEAAAGGGGGHPPPSTPSLCTASASGGPALEDRVRDGLQGPEAVDPGQRGARRQSMDKYEAPRFQGCFLTVAAVGTGTTAAQTGGELPVVARLGSEARRSPGGAAAGGTSPLWPPGLWVLLRP